MKKVKEYMKRKLFYAGLTQEEYRQILPDLQRENRKSLQNFSIITIIFLLVMFLLSFASADVQSNRWVYLGSMLITVIIFAIAKRCENPESSLLIVDQYAFVSILFIFGIILGTVTRPDEQTVTFVAFLLTVPLLFTDKPIRMISCIFFFVIAFSITAIFVKEDYVLVADIIDVTVFGTISAIISTYMMSVKCQRFLYRAENESLEQCKKTSQEKISKFAKFIADMVRYASSEENPDKVINQLVQYIGENVNSDRAYIFEENSRGTFDNTYEWCREGVSKEINNLQNVPFEGIIDIWYQQFKKSHNIIIHDIEKYKAISEDVYGLLKAQKVSSLVVGPIIVEGKMIGFYGVDNPPKERLNDISELIGTMEFMVSFMIRIRNFAKNLEYSALHDQLTNCKNRKALDRFYSEKYDTGMSLAVVMCDLNGLKEVNDRQGHDAGDRFILRTAEILKSVFGEEKVYRMGGDEFIAVLTNISKKDLEEKIELAGIQLGSTASIGIAYKETMDTDFDSVLKIADAEMYKQKNQYYVTTGKSRRK